MLSDKDARSAARAGHAPERPSESAGSAAGTSMPPATSARLDPKVIQTDRLATLGRIVAGVAHEINNPLSTILAYVEYLRRIHGDDEEDRDELEKLGRIEEAAQRVLKLTKDLVAYSRPVADQTARITITDAINRALVFCEHEFARHGVMVEREFATGVPPVQGAAAQLTQVFVNLFTNSAHAMRSSGGRLRILVRREAGSVQVEVADTGIGIEPQDLERVFEPFFTTRVDGGGLGLAIVKEIVEAHGGQVALSSTPGLGTTCELRLPLATA